MEFKNAQIRGEFLYREVDSTGTYEIGVCPVLFGYRVKAGYIDSMAYSINWCAGNRLNDIKFLFIVLKALMEARTVDQGFEGLLPHSKIKPFFNDPEFLNWIFKIVLTLDIDINIDQVELGDLNKARENYINQNFQ